MAVSESRGRWWFETSSYRWNRSSVQLLRNPWEGDGVPYPDSNTSRSGPTNPAPPPMLSPIIKRQWSCSREPVSTTPCLSQAAWMSTFWPWYTAHPQLPSWENNPQCPHQDFIPNICLKCLKYPLSLGFLFLFFFKSNPQNLKYFESYLSAICEDASLHAQV